MQSQQSVNTSVVEKSEKYLEGLRCEEQRKYDEAIKHYIAAINAKGGDVPAYERLIWLCSQTNLSEQSLLKIEKADLFKLIKSIKSVDRQVMLLLQCLNKQTLLGKRFWQPDWGGMRDAALDRGELDNICQYLIQINAGYKQIIEDGDYLLSGSTYDRLWDQTDTYDSKIAFYQRMLLIEPIHRLGYSQKIGELYYMRAVSELESGSHIKEVPMMDVRKWDPLKKRGIVILTDFVQAINHGDLRADAALKEILKTSGQLIDKVNFWNQYPAAMDSRDNFLKVIMTLNEERRPAFLLLCFDASTPLGKIMLYDQQKPNIKEGIFKKIYDELIRIDSNYKRTISQLLTEEENNQLSEVYCKKGEEFFYHEKVDEAIAAYTQAITVNPNCRKAYVALGTIHAKEKKNDTQALIYYTQALTIMPSATLHNTRGLIYRKLKRYEEAIADFNKAIELSEHSGSEEKARFYNNQGAIYLQLDNYEAALSSFAKSIEQNPRQIVAHNNIGYVNHAKGDYKEAIMAYQLAIELGDKDKEFGFAPLNYSAFLGIGSVYYDQGKYPEALEKFDALLSQARLTSSESSHVYYKRGLTNEALKKYEDAVDDYINASERGRAEATNYLWLFLQKDLPLSDSLSKKIRDHLREAFKKTDDERLKHLDSTNVDHHLSALSDSDINKKMTAIRKILHIDIWMLSWKYIYDEALLKIYEISIAKDKDDKTKYQEIHILVEEACSGLHPLRADSLDHFYENFYKIESTEMAAFFAKDFYRDYEDENKGDGVVRGKIKWLPFLDAIIELDPKEKYYMARAVYLFKEIEKAGQCTEGERNLFVASLKLAKQGRQFNNFLECKKFAGYYERLSLFQEALDCYSEFSLHRHDDCCLPMARLYLKLDNHREALLQYHWFYIVSDNSIQNEEEIKAFLNNLVEKNGFDDSKKDEVQVTALSSDGDMRMLKALMNKMSLEAVHDFKMKMKEKMPVLLEKLEELTSCEQSSVTVSQTSYSFLQRIGNSVGLTVEEQTPQANFTTKRLSNSDNEGL